MANIFTRIVSEMVGRDSPALRWFASMKLYDSIGQESFDYSKPNFALSRAIYYSSPVKDISGKLIGDKYALGASFGKPIVNSSTAFAFAKSPTITSSDEGRVEPLNDWLKENYSTLFECVRYSLRDGVSYLRIKDDLTPVLLSGDRVDIQIDPKTGQVIGYDVEVVVKEDDTLTTKFRTEFRKEAPHITVVKVEDGRETTLEEVTRDGEQPLDIVAFHNEKEPSFVYGVSEFQNIYYLMANYHAILESAVQNNIFNSKAIPYIKGVDDANTFLQAYGEREDDGTYSIDWEARKVLIGGKDFSINAMEVPHTATEADSLLNLLFWSICQTSETPEFLMGTAVRSSKASVSEQMPIVVRKANRKQLQFEEYFRELIELLAVKMGIDLGDYSIVFPEIVRDDLTLNMDIVRILSNEGIITDRTKAIMLGLDKYVDSIDEELEEALTQKLDAEQRIARAISMAREVRDEADIE